METDSDCKTEEESSHLIKILSREQGGVWGGFGEKIKKVRS